MNQAFVASFLNYGAIILTPRFVFVYNLKKKRMASRKMHRAILKL